MRGRLTTAAKAGKRAASTRRYSINEMFFSLQGEGARAGTPNVFVRFSGCNMRCDLVPGAKSPGGFACDTEFESGRAMTGAAILAWAKDLAPKAGVGIIFTGGEPALQLDRALVDSCRAAGFGPLCIETNGTIDVAPLGLDWISLSPKVAEHSVRVKECSEVRYVRGHGQAIPRPRARAGRKFISPAFAGDSLDAPTLRWCVVLVKANPEWALSVQQHKTWGIR